MAKLFGSDYHEHSNTWYFKEKAENYRKDEVTYDVIKDESENFIFTFSISPYYKDQTTIKLKIKYNVRTNKIEHYECSECSSPLCKHYLGILQFGYYHLPSQILEKKWVVAYQTKLTTYNEYWQKVKQKSRINLIGLTDKFDDKVRIHFEHYDQIDIVLIGQMYNKKIVYKLTDSETAFLEQVYPIFSIEELIFIDKLIKLKSSVSRKKNIFTISKANFSHCIMNLKAIINKVYLGNTEESLKISDTPIPLNLFLEEIDAYNFSLQVYENEEIDGYFPGNSSYVLKENTLYPINLPLETNVIKDIFEKSFFVKRHELVYLATVLKRQLELASCTIDIPDSIALPDHYENPPKVLLNLFKDKKNIMMKVWLKYSDDVMLPLNVLLHKAELIEYKVDHLKTWFYISPNIDFEIREFCQDTLKIPYLKLVTDSEYLFNGKQETDNLKKNLFEFNRDNWEIEIEEELKNEFIYRITLNPIFKLSSNEAIDWFSYELSYQINDISITQEELRKFFRSGDKFLKTDDGKLVYINNREVFDEIEGLIKKSQKDPDKKYRSALYKLPWIYQLSSINPAIKIYGDEYLDNMYNNLLTRKLDKTPEIPIYLRAVMRSYQKSGFAWIKMLEKYRLNGILADDMGLGKTVQAISVIASCSHSLKHLIICPKTLLFNWANEFDKFAPHISYLIYEGTKDERIELIKTLNVQVVLCSYAIVQHDLEELQKHKFHYTIIDEAQHIKNPNTHRAKAIKSLKSTHKLALTGTPLENNITELWSIFDFLMPGYLPTLPKFKQLSNSIEANMENNPVQRYISPFILRRKKNDVLIELPDKQEQTIFCKMTEIQEKYYVQIIDSVKKSFEEEKNQVNYIHLLAALTRLRQICDHPYLVDREIQSDPLLSGKTELFEELIVDAFKSGKKFLIFSQYISMLEILKNILNRNEIPYEYLDGSTQDRHKIIDKFNNDSKIRAFLTSLKTGGYGINLTAADTVFIIDPWWNPMVENQAVDRAYRIGQTKKVNVYKLITKGTVEEKIMTLQQTKKDLFDVLIEGGDKLLSHLSINELKNLFDIKN